MVDPVTLMAFVPAALALNLTPGADMMFCLGLGLRAGPRAAWAASAGISAGGMVHVLVAALGLGTLLQALPHAFDVIRWVGVGYLLWLAVQALRAGAVRVAARGHSAAFRAGLWVNLTNPKVILFVLAFLPQFVDPGRALLPQFLILGAILSTGGLIINGVVGMLAARAAGLLERGARVLNWLSVGIFGALALRLAVLERT